MSREKFEYEAGKALRLPTNIIELARKGEGYDHAYDSMNIMQPLNGWWHWWKAGAASMQAERDQLAAECAALKAEREQIAEIGELIRTQDNRITDQPFFAVMTKREMISSEDHDYDRICWVENQSGNYVEATETQHRRLEAIYQGRYEVREGWDRFAMKEIDVFVTGCFTEHACKEYIRQNGHNLNKPFIYAFGSYRNHEYQKVRKFIMGIPQTPATDRFLAELRAQQWTEGSEPEEFGRYWVRYETDVGPQYCSAKWMEHNFCASSNTNIHKIWLADHSRSINSLKGVTHYTKLPSFLEGVTQ